MRSLLLLTNAVLPSTEVLPALGLLQHQVRVLPAEATALLDAPSADVVLVDGRRDLPAGPEPEPAAAHDRAPSARCSWSSPRAVSPR